MTCTQRRPLIAEQGGKPVSRPRRSPGRCAEPRREFARRRGRCAALPARWSTGCRTGPRSRSPHGFACGSAPGGSKMPGNLSAGADPRRHHPAGEPTGRRRSRSAAGSRLGGQVLVFGGVGRLPPARGTEKLLAEVSASTASATSATRSGRNPTSDSQSDASLLISARSRSPSAGRPALRRRQRMVASHRPPVVPSPTWLLRRPGPRAVPSVSG